MERAWPSRTRRMPAPLPPSSKPLNTTAERLSRSRRTLPTSKLSRARSKRRSLRSADWMCLSIMPAQPFRTFEETTLEEMDRVIDINLRGVLATTQAALKHMNDGGRIIMIGSAVGERAVAPGLVPYAATKGAVKMFTQALSREVGSRGITVNNVQPGPIDTDLNP